jgi:hypothetical protein
VRLAWRTDPALARELRGQVEDALAAAGWPWRPALSRWIDSLVIAEEQAQ